MVSNPERPDERLFHREKTLVESAHPIISLSPIAHLTRSDLAMRQSRIKTVGGQRVSLLQQEFVPL